MAAGPESEGRVPEVIERLVRKLIIAHKAVGLYPAASAIPRDAARDLVAALDEALREMPEVRFTATRDGLFYEETQVFPGVHSFVVFAREFYNRMLSEVRFHVGTEPSHMIAFLTLLNLPPEELDASGGFEARLWGLGVSSISVVETKIVVVDAEGPSLYDECPAMSVDEIDHLVEWARRGSESDRLTIARFMGDPASVRNYLMDTLLTGGASGFRHMTDSFAKLAHLAEMMDAGERDEGMRALAEAVLDLAEDARREFVTGRILTEARSSKPLAAVIRQMDVEQLRVMLEASLDAEKSCEGMTQAIRNLTAIAGVEHDRVMAAASAVLLAAGFEPSEARAILDGASPCRLAAGESAGTLTTQPPDAVIALIGGAPALADVATEDPDVRPLKEEARQGVSDGDVIGVLVTLVTLDHTPESFNMSMTRLERSIAPLIERGEIQAAAEITMTLGVAAKNPELPADQRDRLVRAIASFARAENLRAISEAQRLYPPGSPEHNSALRLIKMLGPLAIKPLLDQLADEPDMAVRKALIESIGGIAQSFITDLGEQISDPRWYFVRNVVSILGTTKSQMALPYLERAIRHSEARVRRETIRAVSLLNDPRASAMLIQSLHDDDAQNVQLAARYIGQGRVAGAVPTLEQVARGEGRGNRENGPRIEAIEALGRIGAAEALPTLNMLAGKRGLLGRSKGREVRTAALAATTRIEAQGGVK